MQCEITIILKYHDAGGRKGNPTANSIQRRPSTITQMH
jgi:hypothetical protein